MAKIVIIAPDEADDDVKDAVKLLKAAGHDVDTDEPTPKALLHIVLGLMGPNAYGFGPGYGFVPGGSGAAQDDDNDTSGGGDPGPEVEDGDEEAAASDDNFNFESLGEVSVDGEMILAESVDSDTSFLCVEKLTKGAKTTYALNESMFSFWPANPEAPCQRVEIVHDKHRTSIEIAVQESEGKPTLKVGRDLIDMFETKKSSNGEEDDDISFKVGQQVKNIQPMRAGKAYAKFGSPAAMGDEGKVTNVHNLRDVTIVQFKKSDGSEVYTHVQNLK